jgi:outer membrane biosynthesis protein TonB
MKRAVIISAILHVLVVAVAYFGLPIFFDPPQIESSPTMAVEIVMPEQVPQKPVPQPEPVVPPPPPPLADATVSPPPPPPMAMPELAPEPVPPPPKVKLKPKPKPKPKVAKKARPKKPAKVARVAPKPKRKPPPPDEFRKLLKDLTKRKKPAPKVAKKTPKIVKLQTKPIQSAYARRQVENELSKKVRQQIVPCWNIPGGAKNAQKMKIGVRIRLNRDGSLHGNPRVIDTKRFRSDQSFRVVAESAVRALLNPRCSPLRLPYGQYEVWKDITFNFDPSEALGP